LERPKGVISPEFCQTTGLYNQFKNNGLRNIIQAIDEGARGQYCRVFFRSIFETVNHLLWGDLTGYSDVSGRELTEPKALCVTHSFNHQTDYRGQIHAMLTAAGKNPQPTDFPFMPER
jgi:uncharacterized damage-inducible protein DinB